MLYHGLITGRDEAVIRTSDRSITKPVIRSQLRSWCPITISSRTWWGRDRPKSQPFWLLSLSLVLSGFTLGVWPNRPMFHQPWYLQRVSVGIFFNSPNLIVSLLLPGSVRRPSTAHTQYQVRVFSLGFPSCSSTITHIYMHLLTLRFLN